MSVRVRIVVLSILSTLPALSPSRAGAGDANPRLPAMRVVVDPTTGALRAATPEEARALEPRRPLAAPFPDLPVVTLPDGSRMIRLDDRHFPWAVVGASDLGATHNGDAPPPARSGAPTSAGAGGAEIVIVDADPPGAGLNDERAVAPVGGNTGTTLGQQRLIALQEAARVWGALLPGGVPIRVRATFPSLPCTAFGAVLGAARPTTMVADFPSAPIPGTWYPAALANRLSGSDLDPSAEEIEARFNGDIGTTCPLPRKLYLGLDNAHGPDANLVTVALHELAHGLGFISLADQAGHFQNGMPAIYDRFLFDDETRTGWIDMATDAERAASATRAGRLVWTGPSANAFAATLLSHRSALRVSATATDPFELSFGPGSFGTPFTGSVEAALVEARSASGDGCEPISNAAEVAGSIALVNRGACAFAKMVKGAQAAGAVAALVVDPSDGFTSMFGTDPGITIPSAEVSGPDGRRLREALPTTVFLGYDTAARSGTDTWGRLRLYAPEAYQGGSSVSHVDTTATPSLLMEPSASSDLPIGVDVTLPLFADLGWFAGATPSATYLLPSAAHAPGKGGAFYTTDLTVSNEGAADTTITFRFLGHDRDGRTGPETTRTVPAGGSLTISDLLGSLFDVTADYGAVRVTADSTALRVTSQTSTPSPTGGTFGQSVAAQPEGELVSLFASRVIPGVRDDAGFRTNLVLASGSEADTRVDLALIAPSGLVRGTGRVDLPPLGMTQVNGIAAALGAPGTRDGVLVVSTPTGGARVAAYASVIDDETNDPRTIPALSGGESSFLLPSSAHAPGRNGALYTTDLTIANRGKSDATVALRFHGHERDGRTGPELSRTVPAGSAVTFTDVLGSLFGVGADGDYGAIGITSSVPGLRVVSQTFTPSPAGFGTFGQAVPAETTRDFVTPGTPRSLQPLVEDLFFRTNVVLANASETGSHVDVTLRSASGLPLGSAGYDLLPLEMRQLNGVITLLGGPSAWGASGAVLVITTPTAGARVACYASVIDDVTNDPRTILP